MKLIIGGAYQGKKQYARDNYSDYEIIEDFHLIVLELLKEGCDPIVYLAEHLSEYSNKVITCDDISCGVVPMDLLMRKWREATGRALSTLSRESEEVVRIFCGIATKIK